MQHSPRELGAGPPLAPPPHLPADLPDARATGAVSFGVSHATEASPHALEVRVERVLPAARGRLDQLIDESIERALHGRHAGPPGIGAAEDADARLSDQLFRARQVGARRLSLSLPALAPIAGRARTLSSDDSETLVFWARATRERPVDLQLDSDDLSLSAHVEPIPLALALDASRATEPSPVPFAVETTRELPPDIEPPEPVTVPRDPTPQKAPNDGWRSATLALTAARGPQPLAALERLFATSYLPLDTALHDPTLTADARAVHARDEFRSNFSRVYLEAFHAFTVTGKRPRMVLDAPEIAARIARQTSARTSQILLVDSLRYDVGMLVKDELVSALAQKAALTNELVLWSALPTTTTHQLATLVRGVSALEGDAEEEREDGAIRGRTAQTIRRMKIGSRDLYRLDLCDVRIREAAERTLVLLPSIAADVAAAIAKYAMVLAPRTLLLVFGDHGFTIGRDGTPSAGGSSPEEVLVPAFAFLVGEAH